MSGKFQSNCFGMSGLRLLTTPLVPWSIHDTSKQLYIIQYVYICI
jgi:hypothetical protein